MDLVNYTPYPALLYRFLASDDTIAASVLCRVTYDIVGNTVRPSTEQAWMVSPKPWECDYGPMEADEAFYKGGVDVFLFGHARAPMRRPAPRVDVSVEIGSAFRYQAAVFGLRAWIPRGRELVPSTAQPFVEMPLTPEHAYGGRADWDGLEVAYADNPNGKGYYLEPEQAVGQPLPNIEDPRHLIRRWNDYPPSVGFGACPIANSQRLQRGLEFDDEGILSKMHGRFFNTAYPDMVASRVVPGDIVRVTGVRHEGPLSFVIPPSPVRFRLQLGQESIERPLTVDQVGIEPDRNRFFIAYRYPFRYVLRVQQSRSAELLLEGS